MLEGFSIVSYVGTLIILGVVAFVQNMAFTAVSRSRNGADLSYHRKCAWASNSIWLICSLLIWKQLWAAFSTNNFWLVIPLAVVYVAATTEGSVFMMKKLLQSEKGARRVGAYLDDDKKK